METPRGTRRPAYVARDLTTGSIPKNLWFLGWPQMVQGALTVIDQFVDFIWAGRIGARTMAAVGVAQSYAMLAMTGRMGLDIAARAMVSRAVGANNIPVANHATLQAFTLSSAYSLGMAIVGLLLTETLLSLVGASEAVIAAGATYMRIQLVGMAAGAFHAMSSAALQASGDPMTPMKSTMASRFVHILLSPCLVFGLLWFPRMGIAGAALANIVALSLGAAVNFYALFTGGSRLHLTLQGYRLDFPLMWRIVKLGTPAAIASIQRSVNQVVLVGVVASFGDYPLAAYSLTRRVENIAMMSGGGFGQAGGTLAGQNLGAGKPERAKSSVAWAVSIVAAIQGLFGIFIIMFPEGFISIFSREPGLVGPAVTWVRIAALQFLLMGPTIVFSQCISTAGETMIPMMITVISGWVLEIPLAIILSRVGSLGQFGVPWASAIAMGLRLLVYIPYFLRGSWTRKRIIEQAQPKGAEVPAP